MTVPPLPSGAVLLHVGPHKTGSTAVQVALFAARDEAARRGILMPGSTRRPKDASRELFKTRADPHASTPRWDALRDAVANAEARRVCISDELLGKADDSLSGRIVEDLGGDRAHVVAVARHYDAYLPSQWQQRVKGGITESYEDWLRIVLSDEEHPEARNVWRSHDTAALVRRWTQHVDPDRFTLVVSDERDREQLPRLFERLLDLPDGLLRADPGRSNVSMGYGQLELIRQVNSVLESRGVSREERSRTTRVAVRRVLARTEALTGPRKPGMPPWADALVRARSADRVEALHRLPVRVVGSPELLAPSSEPAAEPPDPPDVSHLVPSVLARLGQSPA